MSSGKGDGQGSTQYHRFEPYTSIGPDALLLDAARELELTENLLELEVNGYTVIPPEKVGSSWFREKLRDAVVSVHKRRMENSSQADAMKMAHMAGAGELTSYILWEDPIFETALMNPVVQLLARAMTGHACRLSMIEGVVKPAGNASLGLHCDSAMSEPYPPVPQFCNVTYALTDYSAECGSTTFVPGSHRLLRQPVGSEVNGDFSSSSIAGGYGTVKPAAVPVTCKAGSIVAWSGLTWHGAVPRTAPGDRVSVLMYFCRWYLKTQENFRDHVPPESLKRHGPRFAQLLDVNPVWGYTDRSENPIKGVFGREVYPILDVSRP